MSSCQDIPSLAEIEAELSRRSVVDFGICSSRGRYQDAPHLRLLEDRLRNLSVFGGDVEVLLVFMPPRHSKSTTLSRYLPAWFLGKFPDKCVTLAAHTDSLASRWGRRVRDTLTEYGHRTFGVRVADTSSAKGDWEIAGHEGGMFSCGVDGALPGRGADLAIVDDPIKTAKQAASAVYRDAVWEWWESGLMTRIEPGGSVVVVMHRWHEDDLCGRILKQAAEDSEALDEDGQVIGKVDVLSLPAIAEDNDPLGRKPGEALWPERYSAARLKRRMERVGPYYSAALYQQRPGPREGGMFKVENFKIVHAAPTDIIRVVRYWDLAATAQSGKSDPDYMAGAKLGLRRSGKVIILDMERCRLGPGDGEKKVRQVAELDGRGVRIVIEEEGGSSGKSLIYGYVTRVLAGFSVQGKRSTGSKELRAEPLAAQVAVENVELLAGAWNRAYIDECRAFPTGAHDDQVDASAGAYEFLMPGQHAAQSGMAVLAGSNRGTRFEGNE